MEQRRDAAWVERCLRDPAARMLPLHELRHLVSDGDTPRAIRLPAAALGGVNGLDEPILLGLDGDVPLFAVEVRNDEFAAALAEPAHFTELRSVGALLHPHDAGLLALARALVHWRARARYCSSCGSPTTPVHGGTVRLCRDPGCAVEHFPRTDPAIIVLVTEGDACLLGRQETWPVGRYSTLAGFVEPGESLEDAAAREVMEEAGVALTGVTYHSSQPWPFPSSLMVGFTATARSRELHVDHRELDDARWFARPQIRAGVADGTFRLPSEVSIAHALLQGWLLAD